MSKKNEEKNVKRKIDWKADPTITMVIERDANMSLHNLLKKSPEAAEQKKN
jgi:hypothetical protein